MNKNLCYIKYNFTIYKLTHILVIIIFLLIFDIYLLKIVFYLLKISFQFFFKSQNYLTFLLPFFIKSLIRLHLKIKKNNKKINKINILILV